MSDYESRAADAAEARFDDAMEREHVLLNAHEDPTDFPHCYLCIPLVEAAEAHAAGKHDEPVDGCRACEDYDDDAMIVVFPSTEAAR